MREIAKYNADQARDDHGRWTAGPVNGGDPGHGAAAQMAHAMLPGHDADVLRRVAAHFRVAGAALHEKARELAGKVKQSIVATRLHVPRPIAGTRGVEFSASHPLPNDTSHLRSHWQVNPHDLRNPRAQRALAALHDVLAANGVQHVVSKSPQVGVTFQRGPAPQR